MTRLLIRLFAEKGDVNDVRVRRSYGNLSGGAGIFCNALLCAFKITVGLLSGAMALVADGLNNLTDMGSCVITLIGFKLAAKPADRDHPYGHGRIECMSALLVAVVIILVGAELFKSSLKELISGSAAPGFSLAAVIALAVSIAVKLWMFFFNRAIAKRISSEVLAAAARDSIGDAAATAAILVSVAVSALFPVPFNLDAAMALLVSLFIMWTGIITVRDTVSELLGTPPEPELIEEIRRTALSFDGFLGLHDLIVHSYGPGRRFASLHIEVPQDADMVLCHERIDLCEKLIYERTGVETVIHMDPIDTGSETQRVKKIAEDAIKEIDGRLSLHDFRMTPCGNERTNLIFDVVAPADYAGDPAALKEEISEKLREADASYCCIITVDRDFTGGK